MFDPEVINTPLVLETKKIIGEGMEKRSVDELIKLLGHADRRVRQAAQFELAGRDRAAVAALTALATKGEGQLARIHAIWALAQTKETVELNPIILLLKD